MIRTLAAIAVAITATSCAAAHRHTFQVIDASNTRCDAACSAKDCTCVAGFDYFHGVVVACDFQNSDVCVCMDEGNE